MILKRFIPRRVIERNRWLRSDGKPSFRTSVRSSIPELKPLLIEEIVTISYSSKLLDACESMSRSNQRLLPITSAGRKLLGIVTGMDIISLLAGGKGSLLKDYKVVTIYDFIRIPIGKIMNEEPIVIDINTDIEDALSTMILNNLGALPVVSKDNEVLGILSESSIVRFLAKAKVGVRVGEVMSREVITGRSNLTLRSALEIMYVSGIRRLPIISDNRLVGVLTWKNVIDLIGQHEMFKILRTKTLEEFLNMQVTSIKLSRPLIAHESLDLGDVVNMMQSHNTDYALVVEDKVLKGIITERDILYGLLVK